MAAFYRATPGAVRRLREAVRRGDGTVRPIGRAGGIPWAMMASKETRG
jgi:hypothetical protein